MGQGGTVFFDVVTIIFVILTLLVGLVILGIASGSMESPILAPAEEEPLPTQAPQLTLTPSPVPGAELGDLETPAADSE